MKIKLKNKKRIGEIATQAFLASMQCQLVCGDGSGKRTKYHVFNCPRQLMSKQEDVNL